ncbi:Lar family restriction alleviation protein [Pseudomonas nicosulfuronedens]
MDRILIVLREGLGLNFQAMRPALQVGAPIAIGRGGAVIAEVLEDFPAAHALRLKEIHTQLGSEGHGHVLPRLDGTVMRCGGPGICKTCQKERLLLDIWQQAAEPSATYNTSSDYRLMDPELSPTCCGICSQQDHVDENCPWQGARAGLALVQKIDRHLVENAQGLNAAPSEALKPSIFDIITGTAGQASHVPQVLPTTEEHHAQIERVAADLREHGSYREELKPCAFCGGPPVPFVQLASQGFGSAPRMDSYGDDGLSIEAFVFCHECGAHGPMFSEDIFDASEYDQAMAEGVRLWQDRDGRHADLYEANSNLNLFPRLDSLEEGGGA